MLQRLGELAGALLFGVEQPPVLDRDHRLIGESLYQPDLRRGERPDLASPAADDPDRLSLSNDRNRHKAPVSKRALQYLAGAGVVVSTSSKCTAWPSTKARPMTKFRFGGRGNRL